MPAYLPLVILLAGAVLAGAGRRLLPPSLAGAVLPATLLTASLAILRLTPAADAEQVLVRWLPYELFRGGLALAPEKAGLLLAGAASWSLLAAGLSARGEESGLEAPGLLLLTGVVGFLWAANLVTALLAWTVMDAGLAWLIWRACPPHARARRFVLALATNFLAGLSLTFAAVLMAHLRATTTLQVESLPLPVLRLLWLAGAVRLALYPLHLWLPFRQRQTPLYATLGTLPLVAGGYLLVRSRLLYAGPIPGADLLVLLAALNLVVSGLLAWRSRWWAGGSPMIMHHGAWLAASIGLGGELGVAAALWQALAFTPAVALWAATERAGQQQLGRWTARAVGGLRLAALGSLAGVPPALGFLARWMPLRLSLDVGLYWLPAAALAGSFLLWLSLVQELRDGPAFPLRPASTSGQGRRLVLLPVFLLGVPFLVLGLQPMLVAAQLEFILGEGGALFLADLVRGVDRRLGALIIAVILLPVAGAHQLRHLAPPPGSPRTHRLEVLGEKLHLDWLYRALWRVTMGIASAMRALTRFVEGEGFLSWILLATILLLLLLR